ncbi:MAG: gliding motility-associated C-terminal domain-containing protein [Cyclobacteriaceae bacterium]
MKTYYKLFFLITILILWYPSAHATHIRAGEITAVRTGQLEYRFTVTGFRDTGSDIPFGGGLLSLGDGTQVTGPFNFAEPVALGNDVEMVSFTYTHSYRAQNGNGYLVSYEEDYRNADIINMDNSVGTTFFVETLIIIDGFYGLNDTPVLTVPPIDYAAVGALFIHNPGAYDPDGDSLAYKFVTPKKNSSSSVDNYRELINPEFYSNFATGSEDGNPPTLTINPVTGDLVWDAPGDGFVSVNGEEQREYNVAFMVEEWREIAGQYRLMGYVVRDMQIIVTETDNERPIITPPEDVCVEAGQQVKVQALATDPDGQPVKLEAFGGPFEVTNSAIFSPDTFQNVLPAVLNFEWNTTCANVRERPYEVQIKATDNPEIGPSLVEFETFQITVVGPPPTGLTAEVSSGRSMQLNWDDYSCSEASDMQIWRKTGEFDIELDECQVGMPANTGYQLIDVVDISETSYLDTNNDNGLSAGATYCYRLVAEFPLPEGGLSYVSAEACDSVIIDVPVITNVDILSTSDTNGQIEVKWVPPYQIDQVLYPPNYTYDLFRKSNESGSPFVQLTDKTLDTAFIDSGLNTMDLQHTYFVRFYSSSDNDMVVDSSATASSIRLELRPLVQAIQLSWNGDVPWSLRSTKQPYHYIFRDRINATDKSELVLIDSVDVTQSALQYVDAGQSNGVTLHDSLEYCYFVTTNGTYDNVLLPEPLVNKTQISCAQPNDTIPPCTPPNLSIAPDFECEAFLSGQPCDNSVFQNKIIWDIDNNPDCDDEIREYNIYFSETGEEGSFEIIGTSVATEFIHYNLDSFKGCYRVGAVDRSGNESMLTEQICNDNCPFIRFPNVFTPNGDNVNDVYTPMYTGGDIQVTDFNYNHCPRFVLELDFRVMDRTGNLVFDYSTRDSNENDFLIRWNGKSNQGLELPAGVYYYEAVVLFNVFDPKKAKQQYKGWIQLVK